MTTPFRLSTLLRLRLEARDERRAELAKALRAEGMLNQQQEALAREASDLLVRSRALASPGEVDLDALIQNQRYGLLLKARGSQLAEQLAQVVNEVARRRAALVEADREVRMLEKLREKQAAAQRLADERREQKLLDERGTLGYHRREVLP
ncbi:MAG: flagellar export protein FliJ [Pirellulaceae bacterium]|jgi:flagellar export protein FliJ|nr:flagellar export protein FliJ [Pirellulaceae bacterium]